MNYLTSVKGNLGVVVYVKDGVQVASFPATLNRAIPEIEEVENLCADYVEPARSANHQSLPTLSAGKQDSKGREIGYTVYVYQWLETGDWYAVVQNARLVKGQWEDFGVGQRGKKYSSEEAAKSGGLWIAKDRIAKIK